MEYGMYVREIVILKGQESRFVDEYKTEMKIVICLKSFKKKEEKK